MQEHGATTLADFEAHIEEINEEAKPLQTEVTAIRDRRRQINYLLNAGKRNEELKPVFTEYSKIRFKKAKEKYAAEHDKKLRIHFACRRKIKERLDDIFIVNKQKNTLTY